ncbi:MAG: fructose 1,6-bisphosphatase [Nitrososphaerales archaeon]|nr:fructose 1,6-bisphosphatase [Nitrososphaerales archaeon]
MTNWEKLLTDATSRVQEAVNAVLQGSEKSKVLGVGASGDLTLVADSRAERELIDSLTQAIDVRILSEEIGQLGAKDARYLAVLDPLDGSSNFSRGIPFYCTSVGVIEGNRLREEKYALVRNLVTGDVYYAEAGNGARKNGKRIRASSLGEVSEAVVGVDISRASPAVIEETVPLIASIKRQVHFGANALELCLVAEGILDAFVDIRGKMRVTDFAAAHLIAREAGAVITSAEAKEIDPQIELGSRFGYVAAGNETLHRQLISRLRSHAR